jgi:hypothetical protein
LALWGYANTASDEVVNVPAAMQQMLTVAAGSPLALRAVAQN